MRFEVYVEPFDAASPGFGGGAADEFSADASQALVGVHRDVEEKGVPAAVPGDVDETDQDLLLVGAEVEEATSGTGPKRRREWFSQATENKSFRSSGFTNGLTR